MSSLFEKEEKKYQLMGIRDIVPFTIIESSLDNFNNVLDISGNIQELSGYKRNSFLEKGMSLFSIIYKDDYGSVKEQIETAILNQINKIKIPDFKLEKVDGELITVSCYIQISSNSFTVVLNDVSEYYQKIEQDKKIINRYKQFMPTINEGIWDWNIKSDNVYYSQHWKRILGYGIDEIKCTINDWKDAVHPDDLEHTMNEIENHLNGETPFYKSTHRIKKKSGEYIWVLNKGVKHIDKEGKPERMIGSLRDITDEKEIRDNLEKMIITDELTELYNRRHYCTQINEEILRADRYNNELSIIMIDIDLFKHINDTYGHSAGDLALKELAFLIKREIRNTDSAYRIGGEEFLIIAPETPIENSYKAAERLREAVSKIEIETKYGIIRFTISLGVTNFAKNDTYDSINERVDEALYYSKDTGRNCTTIRSAP